MESCNPFAIQAWMDDLFWLSKSEEIVPQHISAVLGQKTRDWFRTNQCWFFFFFNISGSSALFDQFMHRGYKSWFQHLTRICNTIINKDPSSKTMSSCHAGGRRGHAKKKNNTKFLSCSENMRVKRLPKAKMQSIIVGFFHEEALSVSLLPWHRGSLFVGDVVFSDICPVDTCCVPLKATQNRRASSNGSSRRLTSAAAAASSPGRTDTKASCPTNWGL